MFKRLATAAVGIPVVLWLISFSEISFFLLLLVVVAGALHELFTMMIADENRTGRLLGVLLGCLVFCAAYYDMRTGAGTCTFAVTAAVLTTSVFLLFCHGMFSGYVVEQQCTRIAVKVFGLCYIALLLSYCLGVRARPDGTLLVFLLLAVTWAGDSGAYFIGTWLGKHRLCEAISPKKTVEGAAGGLAASVLIAVAFRALFIESMSIGQCIVIGVGVNVLNQVGDLFESMLKRSSGVKDSGSLLPGHGGVLDRIDSVLFAAPFLFYYISWVNPVL